MNIPVEMVVFILALFVTIIGGVLGVAISLIKKMFTGLELKITGFCNENTQNHQEMWRVLHSHGHTCCTDKSPKVYTVE